jgi:DNA mismatch repair protein MutS2
MEVFPSTAPERLGFDLVLDRIARHLQSETGRDRFSKLQPLSNRERLLAELERVSEVQRMLRFDDPAPFEPVPDVRLSLRAAAPAEAYVDPIQLLEIASVLSIARRMRSYLNRRKSDYQALSSLADRLPDLSSVEESISRAIEHDGRIRDNASPELARLRATIQQREAQLRETLNRELRAAIGSGYATEDQPTIRQGRMVIPIRAEARRKIQGFVQDTSSTGQTVYIEPAACLDLNNEIRELTSAERREIERILRHLTAGIRGHLPAIRDGIDALSVLDVLYAKARFSNLIESVIPTLNQNGFVDVRSARNPVLELLFRENREQGERAVVPLDLQLGADFRTLVITGPNAGGKTVAMKTIGLFALMIAHGLPIPVDERSSFPVFQRLMADIGDDQSMEDDLSTFSSHVAHLKRMVKEADEHALVLIDEAGTGTDPDEGGALAQAVLEALTARGARTIATTHHGTLKAFAREQDGVENGSMEFDRTNLSPTYRFLPGRPGSSYAFEIAERSGLDSRLLARARELVGAQKSGLEDLIADFERKTQDLSIQLTEAQEERERARRERQIIEDRLRKLSNERDEIRKKALDEARKIVGEANARVERTIREIREAEAEREATKLARERLDSFRESVESRRRPTSSQPAPRKQPGAVISVGDQVVVDEGTTTAEVVELQGNDALIAQGSMKLRVKQSRLTRVAGKRKQEVRVRQTSTAALPAESARARIDLRGMRVDEALSEVDRFVDDALRTGLKRLEIVHGKGTGALREAVRDRLSSMPEVASFDEAPYNEGGAGVTYVFMEEA